MGYHQPAKSPYQKPAPTKYAIPKGMKKYDYARQIVAEGQMCAKWLNEAVDILWFCRNHDRVIEILHILIWLNEKKRVPLVVSPRENLQNIQATMPTAINNFFARKFEDIKKSGTHCDPEDLFEDFLDQALENEDFKRIMRAENIEHIDVLKKQIQKNRTWRQNAFSLFDPMYVVDHMEGHDFEKWCAMLLKKNDFDDAIVTPASGDQGVDVVAVKNGIRFSVQCKCYSGNLGNSPVQEVFAGKSMYNCTVAAVMTNQYFTDSAKALAEKNDVLLWDRNEIKRMMEVAASKKPVPISIPQNDISNALFSDFGIT